MEPHLTLKQYRRLDLFCWALILLVTESLILFAGTRWYASQLYTVSVTAALTAIVMVRWKGFAAVEAVLGGLVICLIMGASPEQYLVYCLGNLLSLVSLLVIRAFGEERIRESALGSIGFGLCSLLLMQTGRAIVALVLGYDIRSILNFYLTDSLSAVFTIVILWVARRLDGVLEDQKKYLLRIHGEEQEKQP